MKNIAIYGMGGFGREVACLIRSINAISPTWNLLGFFDDGKNIGEFCDYGKCLGGIAELNAWSQELSIVVAIGKPSILMNIVKKISNPNVVFPNLFAPDVCWYDKEAVTFGKGNIISRKCQFSCNIKIGDFNVFNYDIGIGHDSVLGNFNSLMTSTKIAGNVNIGDMNYFGVNSVVLQGITLGNNITLAAGSVAMRRLKDGYTFIGIPANAWQLTKK